MNIKTLNKKAVSLSLSKAGLLQQTGFDKLTLTRLHKSGCSINT
jgi:hypothetical protein